MRAALMIVLAASVLAACGADEPDLAEEREAQARHAADAEDLPQEVTEFLALLARSVDATFQVTFPTGDGRIAIVLSQVPPDRRVDVTEGRRLLRSEVTRGGVRYECTPVEPDGELVCDRAGSASEPGLFDPEVLADTAAELRRSAADHLLAVERRTIAGVGARCLSVTRKDGRPAPEAGSVDGTVCLSADGAVLAVERGDQHLEATGYTRDVPAGTFDLPQE